MVDFWGFVYRFSFRQVFFLMYMKLRVSWHSVTFKAEINKKNPPTERRSLCRGNHHHGSMPLL